MCQEIYSKMAEQRLLRCKATLPTSKCRDQDPEQKRVSKHMEADNVQRARLALAALSARQPLVLLLSPLWFGGRVASHAS